MPISISESKPYLKGISAYIQTEIEPWLKGHEARRLQIMQWRRTILLGGAVLAILWPVALFLWRPESTVWLFVGPSVGVVALSLLIRSFVARGLEGELKRFLMAKLAAFFRFAFDPNPPISSVARFDGLGLVPPYDRVITEDRLSGQIAGVAFDLVEATLQTVSEESDGKGGSKRRYNTVFRGLLMVFDYPRPFSGNICLCSDMGRIANWFRAQFAGGELVSFDDPRFETEFEVFASSDADARQLLDAATRQALLTLVRKSGHGGIRLGFDARQLLITLAVTDRFEPAALSTPLLDPERIARLIGDICIPFDVVETLGLAASPARSN